MDLEFLKSRLSDTYVPLERNQPSFVKTIFFVERDSQPVEVAEASPPELQDSETSAPFSSVPRTFPGPTPADIINKMNISLVEMLLDTLSKYTSDPAAFARIYSESSSLPTHVHPLSVVKDREIAMRHYRAPRTILFYPQPAVSASIPVSIPASSTTAPAVIPSAAPSQCAPGSCIVSYPEHVPTKVRKRRRSLTDMGPLDEHRAPPPPPKRSSTQKKMCPGCNRVEGRPRHKKKCVEYGKKFPEQQALLLAKAKEEGSEEPET